MVKGKRLGMLYVALLLSVMSVAFTSCGKKEESYVVQQDYADAEPEAEFDMLIADAYMNAFTADEYYKYRNEYELASMMQEGSVVTLCYEWYRANDQYSEYYMKVQLVYHGVNGVWGEPQRTSFDSKIIYTIEGEWECKYEDVDIYFKVNRCEGDRIFVEYEFKNFPAYDYELREYSVKDLSSDGEVEMVCDSSGTGAFWKRVGVEQEFSLQLDMYREFTISSGSMKDFPLTKIE